MERVVQWNPRDSVFMNIFAIMALLTTFSAMILGLTKLAVRWYYALLSKYGKFVYVVFGFIVIAILMIANFNKQVSIVYLWLINSLIIFSLLSVQHIILESGLVFSSWYYNSLTALGAGYYYLFVKGNSNLVINLLTIFAAMSLIFMRMMFMVLVIDQPGTGRVLYIYYNEEEDQERRRNPQNVV